MLEYSLGVEDYKLAKPVRWWHRKSEPTALHLAVAALEECRKDQLHHKKFAEFHTAVSKMLTERDKRLQQDIDRLKYNPPIKDVPVSVAS
jgi:hypothetical protein